MTHCPPAASPEPPPRRGLASPRAGAALTAAALVALLCLPRPAPGAYVIDRLLVGIHEDRTTDSPIIQVVPTGSPIEVVERHADFARVRTVEGVVGWVDASYVMEEKPAHLMLAELENLVTAKAAELEEAQATIERLREELSQAGSVLAGPAGPLAVAAAPGGAPAKPGSGQRTLQADLDEALEENRLLREEASLREMAARQDAAAELEALQAELAALRRGDAGAAGARPDLRELQTLAQENRRVKERLEVAEMSLRDARAQTAPAPGGPPWSWSVRDATLWELAALGFAMLLAFFLGAFWVEQSARRRLGGFRL